MQNQQTFMQGVQEIGLDGLRTSVRGIVNKGPLFGFMLMCLLGLAYYIERQRKEFRSDMQEQKAQLQTMKMELEICAMERMRHAFRIDIQSDQIKELQSQIAMLIKPRRKI